MAGITVNGPLVAFAFEKITVSSTAIGLTAATYDAYTVTNSVSQARLAVEAVITVETQPIRYRIDGTDPDINTGHKAIDADVITLRGHDALRLFKAIRQTGSDATIMVTYFRP